MYAIIRQVNLVPLRSPCPLYPHPGRNLCTEAHLKSHLCCVTLCPRVALGNLFSLEALIIISSFTFVV